MCGEPPVDGGSPTRASVVCADCGTLHHRECFEYNEKCAVYACGGYRCSGVGRGGRDVQLLVVGRPEVERVERIILDLTTPAEELAKTLVVVGVCLTLVGMLAPPAAFYTAVPGVFAFVIGVLLASSTDCYYVAEVRTRQLMYHQKIAGVVHVSPALAFDRLARVQLAVRAEWVPATRHRPGKWRHAMWLETVDTAGGRIALADEVSTDDAEWWVAGKELLARGEQLARAAGRPFALEPRRYEVFGDGPTGWMKAILVITLAATMGHTPGLEQGVIAAAGTAVELALLWYAMTRNGYGFFVDPVPDLEQALVLLGREDLRRLVQGRPAPRLPPPPG